MLFRTLFTLVLTFSTFLQAATSHAERDLRRHRTRTCLINYLIEKNHYSSYLEIGVARGENLTKVKAEKKISVDPSSSSPCTHHMTSDDFFRVNSQTFDIIFIDGLHHWEQVFKDIENSLNCLNEGGVIVMHDCKPAEYLHQVRSDKRETGTWNGDVWKAAALIRMTREDLHFCVLDMDYGCGIINPSGTQKVFPYKPVEELDWNFYRKNRNQLLNLMSVEDWLKGKK